LGTCPCNRLLAATAPEPGNKTGILALLRRGEEEKREHSPCLLIVCPRRGQDRRPREPQGPQTPPPPESCPHTEASSAPAERWSDRTWTPRYCESCCYRRRTIRPADSA